MGRVAAMEKEANSDRRNIRSSGKGEGRISSGGEDNKHRWRGNHQHYQKE